MHSAVDQMRRELPPSRKELAATDKNVKELSRISEKEFHTVVFSCKQARRQLLSTLPVDKPTIH